jgi:hypothetical protein
VQPSAAWRERLGLALFGAWLLIAIAVAVVRPGELLEWAMIGAAGTALWQLVAPGSWLTPLQGALCAACFVLPLTNTLPARKYASKLDALPWPVTVALAALTILVVASAVAGRRELRIPARVPRLVVLAGACLVLGGVLGALASVDRPGSLSAAWLQVCAPVVLAYLVLRAVDGPRTAWALLDALWLAAAVPAVVGIAAYVSTFGVPTSGDDLVTGKIQLFRPFLFQEVTFGNVDNTAPFIVLVLPLAVLSAARSGASLAHRLAAGAVSLALGALLLLTLSRGGILVAIAVLAVLAVLLLWRARSAGAAAAALAICACLCIAIGSSAAARSSVLGALTGSSTALTTPKGGQAIADPSLDDRRAAIRKGLDVARDHLPLGVGPDQLARYSPHYHAAHSLPVQVLAEEGVLGLAGLLLVAAFLVVTLVELLRRFGQTSEELALARLAAVAGAGAYLLQGAIVGVPLALGQDMVWAAVLAVLVGVAAALHGREPAGA